MNTPTRILIRTLGAGAIVAGLGLGGLGLGGNGVAAAAPARPAPPTQPTQPTQATLPSRDGGASAVPVDTVKATCQAEIARRLTTLTELQTSVQNATATSPAHKGALAAELAGQTTGLTALGGQIDAATDLATLKELCPKLVSDYRVYLLEVPTVHLTIAGDRLAAVHTELEGTAAKLADAVAKAKAAGKDTGAAETALADMNAQLAASQHAGAIGDTVIPLTPADYNSGAATPVLTSARDTAAADRTALTRATQDARTVVQALKAARS